MSTIIKKFQYMSRNRSRKYCKVNFIFASHKYRKLRHLFCFEACETCIRSTIGNNRLHALILVHVQKNILDNVNLADIANEFVDRRDSRKKTI